MNSVRRNYSLFGLRIRSELDLPELVLATEDVEQQIDVRLGRIDIAGQEPGLTAHNGSLLLVVEKVGRFQITKGTEILVEPADGVEPRNVRLFLLGSAFGALLHQRGLLPLHANAVEIDGKAVAFMGPSGAGKSTLAAWFEDRGHRILTDDVCVIHFTGEGGPAIRPGLARIRLWREAVEQRQRSPSDYQMSFVGNAQIDKFDVPVANPPPAEACLPLACAYVLERGDKGAITRLDGVDAFDAVSANTYRGHYIDVAGDAARHWTAAVALVRLTPMFRAQRRWGFANLDDECERLLEHATRIVRA